MTPTVDFWAELHYDRFGEIGIARLSGSKRRAIRDSHCAKRSPDGVVLSLPSLGSYGFSQARHEETVEPAMPISSTTVCPAM